MSLSSAYKDPVASDMADRNGVTKNGSSKIQEGDWRNGAGDTDQQMKKGGQSAIRTADGAAHHHDSKFADRMDSMLLQPLPEIDKEIFDLLKKEKQMQRDGLYMIASENATSRAVLEALGSAVQNRYSEGYPGTRYYGGQICIDGIETLCQKRALQAFSLNETEWGVNVQPYSGSPANFAVYTALVEPHGRIMGLDLPDGGHLTHGFYTGRKKISCTSLFFESLPYKVNPETGIIDYEKLRENAVLYRPKMIIAGRCIVVRYLLKQYFSIGVDKFCWNLYAPEAVFNIPFALPAGNYTGTSAYSQLIDYAKLRDIADACDALLMADIAHVSGLMAAGVIPSPFQYSDVVTSTTHKSLRGPRAGIIFYRRGTKSTDPKTGKPVLYDYERKINDAIFPGLQGGPHNNTIAALAVALKLAQTNEFRDYQRQVVANSKALVAALQQHGQKIVSDGTENHLCVVDLRPLELDGAKVETVLEHMLIICNKNTCPGDKSALRPGGIRLGTPTLTTRGLREADMQTVADFIQKGIDIVKQIEQAGGKTKTLKEFKERLEGNDAAKKQIAELSKTIQQFAAQFPLPGLDEI